MLKPSEVKEMNDALGRPFECNGNCSHCVAEFICIYIHASESKLDVEKEVKE
jgi:hypothetical protein